MLFCVVLLFCCVRFRTWVNWVQLHLLRVSPSLLHTAPTREPIHFRPSILAPLAHLTGVKMCHCVLSQPTQTTHLHLPGHVAAPLLARLHSKSSSASQSHPVPPSSPALLCSHQERGLTPLWLWQCAPLSQTGAPDHSHLEKALPLWTQAPFTICIYSRGCPRITLMANLPSKQVRNKRLIW